MKVLLLAVDVDLSRNRGDSIHVRELSHHLVRSGHEVRLVTATQGEVLMPEGAIHFRRPERSLDQVAGAARLAWDWARVIYERRMTPKLSCFVSALTRVPFVLEVNGVLEDEIEAQGRALPSRGVAARKLVRGFMMRRAARIVAVSPGIRDYLVSSYRLPPDLVSVIPNGANTEVFRPLSKEVCRRAIGLLEDDAVVCFVGNLVRWQGVDKVFHAIRGLKSRVPRLRILIVGSGPEMSSLTSLAARIGITDQVRFLGDVPYESVPKLIGASDVCVAPFDASRRASPIKVFEYLACGRPVITSDVDDIGAFVTTSGAGMAVEPGDITGLQTALASLLEDSGRALEMGNRGFEVVSRTRSWQRTASCVGALVEEVAGGS